MKHHEYVWSCSIRILVTNKTTDVTRTLAKTSYSKKMIQALHDALRQSFTKNNGLASYVSRKYNKKISSITCTFNAKEKQLQINVITNAILSVTDKKYVENFISGQLSDGWGEGFEQVPFYETEKMDYQMFSLWETLKQQ